jgi:beta propeller repeat protein
MSRKQRLLVLVFGVLILAVVVAMVNALAAGVGMFGGSVAPTTTDETVTPKVVKPALATNFAEKAICTDPYGQQYPRIYGNTITWKDCRNDADKRKGDIYAYDLTTGKETPICTDPANQDWADLSETTIVWSDWRNDPNVGTQITGSDIDIYGYDRATKKIFPICSAPGVQRGAVTRGHWVVWQDGREGDGKHHIYGYDLTTKKEFPICTAPGEQRVPAMDGDIVVWDDLREGSATGRDIYGYNLATKKEFLICNDSGYQSQPVISGNIVVWEDHGEENSETMSGTLRGINLATKERFTIVDKPGNRMTPAMQGNYVVWVEWPEGSVCTSCNVGKADLWGYNLTTKEKFPICYALNNQMFPSVYGDWVVWEDGRNSEPFPINMDIFAAKLTP